MIRSFFLSIFLLGNAMAQSPIRVLVWDEQQPEQKQAYGDKFLGETIAAHLATNKDFAVKSVAFSSADQGLAASDLDATDVVIFWSNKKNAELSDERAQDLVQRVQAGKLALIVLHSAHWSKPFVKLMQARAIADTQKQLGKDIPLRFQNENPIDKALKIQDEITPLFFLDGEQWTLTLPACGFGVVGSDAKVSHVTVKSPTHPIAKGLPAKWDIPQTKMLAEPFHVPNPDVVVLMENWEKDHFCRSACVWNIGKGQVFYFRPGNEAYPIYRQKEPLQVLENAVRWMSPAE